MAFRPYWAQLYAIPMQVARAAFCRSGMLAATLVQIIQEHRDVVEKEVEDTAAWLDEGDLARVCELESQAHAMQDIANTAQDLFFISETYGFCVWCVLCVLCELEFISLLILICLMSLMNHGRYASQKKKALENLQCLAPAA